MSWSAVAKFLVKYGPTLAEEVYDIIRKIKAAKAADEQKGQ